jgi:hypothetical protein
MLAWYFCKISKLELFTHDLDQAPNDLTNQSLKTEHFCLLPKGHCKLRKILKDSAELIYTFLQTYK